MFRDRLLAHDAFLSAAGAATLVPHLVAQSGGSQGLPEICSALLLTSSAIVLSSVQRNYRLEDLPLFHLPLRIRQQLRQ